MEIVPEDPYLKFRANVLHEVRKEFDLHQPGAMEEVVRSFEEWIEKQSHFTKKNFSKHFLEMSILQAKGSSERAKKNLDKLCAFKTLLPKFFQKHNVRNELMGFKKFMVPALLPIPTEDNYRVYVHKVVSSDVHTEMFNDYYRFVFLVCEYLKAHDYSLGFVHLVDFRDINVANLVTAINVMDLRDIVTIFMEGYGMRIKGIHFVTESKAIDVLVSLLKQFLSPKVGSRIQVHKSLESVYEYLPNDILPEEYGGKEKPIEALFEELLDVFSKKNNVDYFKDICESGTDEAHRQTIKFNEEILGMPGSFRSLTVD